MPDEPFRKIGMTVTVADDHLAQIDTVSERLRRSGFDVHGTLASTGIITGAASSDALDALRALAGVAAVEPSGEVHLAPPDSPVQ